jgi:RHS repeat-associated protein
MSRGDPVDVVSGRTFTLPVVDLFFPGPLPLQIERSYSSAACERDVGLGFGWAFSLGWQVVERRRSVRVITFDGVEHDFGPVEPGIAVIGPHGWLVHREGDGFRLDIPDGQRLFFDVRVPSGEGLLHKLSAIADRSNNRIVLSYEKGQLAQVTDAVGRVVRVLRGPHGRIASLEARNAVEQGRCVAFARYFYDALGRLTGVEDADGYLTTFEYDERNLLTSQAGPTGLTFFFRYDKSGRCDETWGTYPGGVDISLAEDVPKFLADHETRARGILHTKFEYGTGGYSEAADSVSLHRYFGNASGLVDKAVTPLGVFERTYDDRGFITSFVDALGATTRWERDLFGRETKVVDPLGRTTQIHRDQAGEILEVIGPDGETTRVDRLGDELSVTDPLGATYAVTFDSRGQPIRSLWPDGRTLTFVRDAHGNILERTDERGAREQARYDAWGRCVEVVDARGGRTAFTYSNAGNLLSLVRPGGSVERYSYDGAGNLTAITDAEGHTTSMYYGGYRKLSRVEKPNGEVVELRYNREGWLSYIRNGRGEVHRFTRNLSGLVIEERGFDGRLTRYGYDAMGRKMWSKNSLGERTEYERDAVGQLVRQVFDDGTQEAFEYNKAGEIVAADCPAGRFIFYRNAKGWIVREEQIVGGDRAEVSVDYRLTGEVTGRRTSLGHTAQWTHDFSQGKVQLSLDGEVASVSTHDVFGREIARALSSGARIEAAYDALGALLERTVVSPASGRTVGPGEPDWVGTVPPSPLLAEAFRYTKEGLLSAHWNARQGSTQFFYDPIGQLARVLRQGQEIASFRYDETGNLYDTTPGAPPRRYGPGDRLEGVGNECYLWDAEGRLLEKRAARSSGEEGVTRYRWTAAGRLGSVELPDGTVASFEYDPFGRRVSKRLWRFEADGARTLLKSTRFVWDGCALVHEITRIARLEGDPIVEERTYVFDQGSTIPLAHRDARTDGPARTVSPWWHYLNDDSGAPEALIGPDGRVVCELSRTPWGAATVPEGAATSTPIRFRGQYADDETGLSYNRHRYYDPKVGRYISADPIGIKGGLNIFAYAGNCPTSAIDADGLMYSVIKGPPPKREVIADARSGTPQQAHPAVEGNANCSEMGALTKLAHKLGPTATKEDVATLFNDKGYTMETFEGREEGPDRANPCPKCRTMIEEMGITKGIIGHQRGDREKAVDWFEAGQPRYEPMGKGQEQARRDAKRRNRR